MSEQVEQQVPTEHVPESCETARGSFKSILLCLVGSGLVLLAIALAVSWDQSKVLRLRKAAEQGDPNAQYSLGNCFAAGRGVQKDEAEAAKWFQKAAEQGDVRAQFSLGNCYFTGRGVRKSESEATKWYHEAGERGFALPFEGDNMLNPEKVKSYREGAEQGKAWAQHNLGVFCLIGLGVQRDETEAAKWFRKAAEQGDIASQYCLGNCYAFGLGVRSRPAEAVKWYRKAAEKGDRDAQFNLGVCYVKGQGVAKNYVEAYKWLNLAGHTRKNAWKARDEIASKMTPEEIVEAKKLSDDWKQ